MLKSKRSEAKLSGDKFYFTGAECCRGHISERLTSTGSCLQCKKDDYDKEYLKRKDNESRKLYNKNYSKAYIHNKAKESKDKYYQKNKVEILKKAKEYRSKNKGMYNFLTQKRRERISRATPVWADLDKIRDIYFECGELNRINKNSYHVDHVIPLQGELVCGLHVAGNLSIVKKIDNLKKGNSWKTS